MESFKLHELIPSCGSPYAGEFAEQLKDAELLVDQDPHFFAVRAEPLGTVLANSKGAFKTPLRLKLGTKLMIVADFSGQIIDAVRVDTKMNELVTKCLEKANRPYVRKKPNGSPRKRRMKRK